MNCLDATVAVFADGILVVVDNVADNGVFPGVVVVVVGFDNGVSDATVVVVDRDVAHWVVVVDNCIAHSVVAVDVDTAVVHGFVVVVDKDVVHRVVDAAVLVVDRDVAVVLELDAEMKVDVAETDQFVVVVPAQ